MEQLWKETRESYLRQMRDKMRKRETAWIGDMRRRVLATAAKEGVKLATSGQEELREEVAKLKQGFTV